MHFLIFFIFSWSAMSWGSEPSADQLLRQVCNLNHAQNSCTSSQRSTHALVNAPPDWQKFYHDQKCSDVLSANLPARFEKAADQAFFTQKNNWIPFCSVRDLERFPGARGDPSLALAQLKARILSMDACDLPEENHESSAYVMPTQSSAEVELLTAEQRTGRVSTFETYRAHAVQACCGPSDQACQREFKKIKLQFCASQKNKNLPDPCIGDGVKYMPGLSEGRLLEVSKSPEKFLLKAGTIQLSPFVDGESDSDLSHELGHACSEIKRQLAVKARLPNALAEYRHSLSCDLDESTRISYQRVFASLKLNTESQNCLWNQAKNATQKRYRKGACENACPRVAVDEAFAETFSVMMEPESELISGGAAVNLCSAMRDSHHLSGYDVMSCIFKTPAVVKRFEQATACQP